MASLLELAQALLAGKPIAKAEGSEDPDAGLTPEQMEAARQEAQAGAQAQQSQTQPGQPGEVGAPAQEVGEAAVSGQTQPDEQEEDEDGEEGDGVEKAQVLKSMQFLAEQYGLTHGEVAKAFSGLEGDPAFGAEPLGKGIESLEGLLKRQESILERIAGFLQELASHTVKLGGEVAKSLEASAAAEVSASSALSAIAALPKTAPAREAKGKTGEEIAKALPEAPPTFDQVMKAAMDPNSGFSPQDIASMSRRAQGAYSPGA